MFELLGDFGFLQNSLISIVFLSILAGIVGSYITLNRLNYLSGGIAHSSFAGVGAAYFFGIEPFVGGVAAAGLMAFSHSFFSEKIKERSDSIISIAWSLGMSLGIIFTELSPGYKPNLMSFLFGDILAVPTEYVISLVVLSVVVCIFFYMFYNRILTISFDEEYAQVLGINVVLYKTVLMVLTSITVILLTKVSGLILVIALVTIPVTISNKVFKKIETIIASSMVIAFVAQLLGLYLSFLLNISTGPLIIVTLSVLYGLSLIANRFFKR